MFNASRVNRADRRVSDTTLEAVAGALLVASSAAARQDDATRLPVEVSDEAEGVR